MKPQLILFIFFLLFSFAKAQTHESQIRMDIAEGLQAEPKSNTDLPKLNNIQSINIVHKKIEIAEKKELIQISPSVSHTRLKRNLKFGKAIQATDSLPTHKPFFQRLGCFLKEPLQLISLGVELFELTKPPKNAFAVILYVIYIVPLFAIITAFILGGVIGLITFIFISGAISFLIYWGILALLGISLTGAFIFWGLLVAFLVGLVVYLLLVRLC
ncbi:hypothetical protein [Raineya sp.]|jgi:hypothetical protein